MKKTQILNCIFGALAGAYLPAMFAQSQSTPQPSKNLQEVPKKAVEDKTHPPRIPSHESIGFMFRMESVTFRCLITSHI